MIPVRLVVLGVTLAVDLIREIPRAVRRAKARKRAEEPVRPADELPLSPAEREDG